MRTKQLKFQNDEQHQQLELDLWQVLAVAQAEPEAANMVVLCRHLEGLDLVDGARAIGEIGEIFRSKAEIVLAAIAASYLPQVEPVIEDELWAHLYQRTFVLPDDHLYLEPEHDYPESRQSVIKLGTEADALVAEEVYQAEVLQEILGNAHSEDIPLWAERIRKVVAKSGDISLVDLQRRSRLPLVDLWLGLLLGDTGCWLQHKIDGEVDSSTMEQNDDFYRSDRVWVKTIL
jgi:hypothetical protein